jgi:hypothetical protein
MPLFRVFTPFDPSQQRDSKEMFVVADTPEQALGCAAGCEDAVPWARKPGQVVQVQRVADHVLVDVDATYERMHRSTQPIK